ncbi:hypothetical protein BGZ76_004299 [Entomortierella beljakovae]|nr:hypothetical protein BGZ76_004299 [Entomortierella beljakovae]
MRNDGNDYWADRVASSRTKISRKRTAGELVAGNEAIAKKLIQEDDENSNKGVGVNGDVEDDGDEMMTVVTMATMAIVVMKYTPKRLVDFLRPHLEQHLTSTDSEGKIAVI